MRKVLLVLAVLLAGCTRTTRQAEFVQGVGPEQKWHVGEYRNCTLDPRGVALLTCATTSEVMAYPTKVVYKGRRAGLGKPTEWECLRENDGLVCEPIQ